MGHWTVNQAGKSIVLIGMMGAGKSSVGRCLQRLGVVVWLDGKEETLFERAARSGNRPLLQGGDPREAFTRMLQARLPLYVKVANIRVDTSVLTDEEVAVAILSKLGKLGRNWRPGSPIPVSAR